MGCCRGIRTTSERRYVSGYKADRLEEYDLPPIRGRRRNLPNRWDDKMRSDIREKSWKKNRKTQWKPKKLPKKKKESKFRGHVDIHGVRRKLKPIWAYKKVCIGREWNPKGFHWARKYINGQLHDVLEKGCWEAAYEWRWTCKKPYYVFFEESGEKILHRPVTKSDPNFFNGKPYFVYSEWAIKWEKIVIKK